MTSLFEELLREFRLCITVNALRTSRSVAKVAFRMTSSPSIFFIKHPTLTYLHHNSGVLVTICAGNASIVVVVVNMEGIDVKIYRGNRKYAIITRSPNAIAAGRIYIAIQCSTHPNGKAIHCKLLLEISRT